MREGAPGGDGAQGSWQMWSLLRRRQRGCRDGVCCGAYVRREKAGEVPVTGLDVLPEVISVLE